MRLLQYISVFALSFVTLGAAAQESENVYEFLTGRLVRFASPAKTLLDIEVSGLQIRLVETSAGEWCPENSEIGASQFIEIKGPIGPDTTEILSRVFDQVDRCRPAGTAKTSGIRVFMTSNGGLVNDGYNIGRLFRQLEVITYVTDYCASSCAFAFLGGDQRYMLDDGRLTFHSPYIREDSRHIFCTSRADADELRNYFEEMLEIRRDAQYLFGRTMDFCSVSDGWTLNGDAAKIMGIATQSMDPK